MPDIKNMSTSEIEAQERKLYDDWKRLAAMNPNGDAAASAKRTYERFLEKTKNR